jgi:SAM-dependent methyltransferase
MTDYEVIADAYRESKRLPIKQYREAFTFFQVLGSLRDLTVLDVACGDGYYTRALKRQGATRVMGVDRSPTGIMLGGRHVGVRVCHKWRRQRVVPAVPEEHPPWQHPILRYLRLLAAIMIWPPTAERCTVTRCSHRLTRREGTHGRWSRTTGTGEVCFDAVHNQACTQHTRVFVKAFLHATCFLWRAVKYGRTLTAPPRSSSAFGRWRATGPMRPIGSGSCAVPRKPMARPIWKSGCGHRRHSLAAGWRSQAGYGSAPSGTGADGTIF